MIRKIILLFIIINSLIFIFMVPPFQKPDEITHFFRTVALSTGQLFCENNSQGEKVFKIPKNLLDLPQLLRADEIKYNYSKKFFVRLSELQKYLNDINSSKKETSIGCSAYFIGFIPNSIGLIPAILFIKNPLVIFYTGRIAGFLFFLILFYYSLKIIPRPFHIVLYLYGIIPMVLHQVSSYSYDVFLLSMTLLVFTYFVKVYSDKKVTQKDFIIYNSSILLLVLSKPFSITFIFLHLLFPFHKIPSKKKKYILISLLFFLISLLLSIFFLRQ